MQCFFKAIIITILMSFAGQISAQRYLVDPFMEDSVTLNELQIVNGEVAVGVDALKIAAGDTVNVLKQIEGFSDYGVIKVDGREYAVAVYSSLCFIDTEEIEDPWEIQTADWRTPDGRFYSTLTPYLWIVGLVLGALLLLLLGQKIKPIKWIALILVPVMIALGCYLEVRGYIALRTRMFWWCDSDYYGFWDSVLRILPFGFVILAQLASFPLYGRLVTREGTPLGALMPMAISFLITLPVLAVVGLVLAIFHVSDATVQIVAGIIFIVIMGVGSISTITLNIKSYGFFVGLLLTIFGAIYIVGAMISVLGFAIALWNLFLQMLVAMLPWLIAAFFLFAAGHARDAGELPSPEAQKRQKEIEERKAKEQKEEEYRQWRWLKRQREEERGY